MSSPTMLIIHSHQDNPDVKTVCPSGLRGWTQVPLAQAAWVQIPQLSISLFCSDIVIVLCRGLAKPDLYATLHEGTGHVPKPYGHTGI